jgi:hypothetical protein
MYDILASLIELGGSAIGVYAFTAGAKAIKAIPVSEGQTARVRTLAGVLSAVASIGVAYANGNLDGATLQNAFMVTAQAGAIWFAAHQTHKVVNK